MKVTLKDGGKHATLGNLSRITDRSKIVALEVTSAELAQLHKYGADLTSLQSLVIKDIMPTGKPLAVVNVDLPLTTLTSLSIINCRFDDKSLDLLYSKNLNLSSDKITLESGDLSLKRPYPVRGLAPLKPGLSPIDAGEEDDDIADNADENTHFLAVSTVQSKKVQQDTADAIKSPLPEATKVNRRLAIDGTGDISAQMSGINYQNITDLELSYLSEDDLRDFPWSEFTALENIVFKGSDLTNFTLPTKLPKLKAVEFQGDVSRAFVISLMPQFDSHYIVVNGKRWFDMTIPERNKPIHTEHDSVMPTPPDSPRSETTVASWEQGHMNYGLAGGKVLVKWPLNESDYEKVETIEFTFRDKVALQQFPWDQFPNLKNIKVDGIVLDGLELQTLPHSVYLEKLEFVDCHASQASIDKFTAELPTAAFVDIQIDGEQYLDVFPLEGQFFIKPAVATRAELTNNDVPVTKLSPESTPAAPGRMQRFLASIGAIFTRSSRVSPEITRTEADPSSAVKSSGGETTTGTTGGGFFTQLFSRIFGADKPVDKIIELGEAVSREEFLSTMKRQDEVGRKPKEGYIAGESGAGFDEHLEELSRSKYTASVNKLPSSDQPRKYKGRYAASALNSSASSQNNDDASSAGDTFSEDSSFSTDSLEADSDKRGFDSKVVIDAQVKEILDSFDIANEPGHATAEQGLPKRLADKPRSESSLNKVITQLETADAGHFTSLQRSRSRSPESASGVNIESPQEDQSKTVGHDNAYSPYALAPQATPKVNLGPESQAVHKSDVAPSSTTAPGLFTTAPNKDKPGRAGSIPEVTQKGPAGRKSQLSSSKVVATHPPKQTPVQIISMETRDVNRSIDMVKTTVDGVVAEWGQSAFSSKLIQPKGQDSYIELQADSKTLLEASTDSVRLYKAFVGVKSITLEQKVAVILGSLGVPPERPNDFPDSIDVTDPDTQLGKAIITEFARLKGENDENKRLYDMSK